jgi:hypothetical protein
MGGRVGRHTQYHHNCLDILTDKVGCSSGLVSLLPSLAYFLRAPQAPPPLLYLAWESM